MYEPARRNDFFSASDNPSAFCWFTSLMTVCFSSIASSDREKYTFPLLSIVIKTTSFWSAAFVDTDFGVVTARASAGLNLVVRMKNDNRRKATSHIAVMSTEVLFRGNFTFGML